MFRMKFQQKSKEIHTYYLQIQCYYALVKIRSTNRFSVFAAFVDCISYIRLCTIFPE